MTDLERFYPVVKLSGLQAIERKEERREQAVNSAWLLNWLKKKDIDETTHS